MAYAVGFELPLFLGEQITEAVGYGLAKIRVLGQELKARETKTNPGNPGRRRKMARRREHLTGGTGDVNPQFYTGVINKDAGDDLKTSAFISPGSKSIFGIGKAGATVMELLKIYVIHPDFEVDTAAIKHQARRLVFCTSDPGVESLELGAPSVIAQFGDVLRSAFTATQSSHLYCDNVHIQDFTDNFGHGVLVATDYIYVSAVTSAMENATKHQFKILYRFKNVGLTEYIGIVQSQS